MQSKCLVVFTNSYVHENMVTFQAHRESQKDILHESLTTEMDSVSCAAILVFPTQNSFM